MLDTVLIGALEVDDTWVFIGLGRCWPQAYCTELKIIESDRGWDKITPSKVIKYFTDRCLHTFVSTVDTGLREKRMT